MVKRKINRASTMDRIEVTYRKYFLGSAFIEKYTSNISEKDIIVFINDLFIRYGYISQKDIERIYQILHSVLCYGRDLEETYIRLYDWERIKRNIPWNKVDSRKKNESALSKETLLLLYTSVLHDNIYPEKRSAALLCIMNIFLGLRIGELASLQFNDFDFVNMVLKVERAESKYYERDNDGNRIALCYKTDMPKTLVSIRHIPLLPQTLEIYQAIQEHHKACGYDSKYLCYDGKETNRTRSIDRTYRRLATLNNIHGFNSHLIRKTFATVLHNQGTPTRIISDILGHSEMSTTEKNYILTQKEAYAMKYNYMVNAFKN